MPKRGLIHACVLAVLSVCVSSYAGADAIKLHIPIVADSPRQHVFFHDLLKKALEADGHTVLLISQKLPQLRIKNYLERGLVSIYWMIESDERNKTFIPIRQGLTNKLIGKRILFIKKGAQPLYDTVNTLEDFRRLGLVGGMGTHWFDVSVWKANDLKYLEKSGNWSDIFRMVARGMKYDYFSRGVNEILEESKQYPDLDIEQRLVLIYDRDFKFYLSRTGEHAGAMYVDLIDHAMAKAQESGLIDRLVRVYWADDFRALNYDKRVRIHLKTPK